MTVAAALDPVGNRRDAIQTRTRRPVRGIDSVARRLGQRSVEMIRGNISRLKGHTGEVYSLAYSPDGRTLASGSLGRFHTGEHETFWHTKTESVVFSPDSRTVGVMMARFYCGKWL